MKFGVDFGALVPPIAKQISSQGLQADPKLIKRWQQDADAILHLFLRGTITDSECSKVRRRLMNAIAKEVSVAKKRAGC